MSYRPNALPARQFTVGDQVKSIKESGKYRARSFVQKTTVGDLCDFCFKNIRLSKMALGLRIKG